MSELTVDISDPKAAIKQIRKASREAKKEEARKSALRGIALMRAEAAAFKLVRAAASEYLVGWTIYRPDGNEYAREGFERLVREGELREGLFLRVETANGNGEFGIWTPSKFTHVIEDGSGWIVGACILSGDERTWYTFGVADDITYYARIDGKLAELCDDFLARKIADREQRDAK